jgi:penicillin-binding protein 1A
VFKRSVDPLQKYPYYVSYVLQLLRDRFSQAEMRRQGLRIYTNLDPGAQEAAEKTLGDGIKKAPKGVSQGALASVNVSDGAVVALVGGVGNFWKNQWNRATNPHTAGSSFKPFVYLTGLIKNAITPDSIVDDSPITIKQGWGLPDWSPKNFDHKFMGNIPVRKALALSRNVVSVRIAQKVGIENVVETARLAGVQSKLDPNLSLALGSSAVTPLEMAGAFATFARGGVAIRPRILRRIEDSKGQVIELFEPRVDKVFQLEPVAELVDMMQDVVRWGTGTQARLPDRPVAGKTGTADEAKDIWFIGFTPDLATAVWGGNDENLAIPGNYVTGGTIMAKIWKDYNVAYYQRNPTAAGSFIAPNRQTQPQNLDGESQVVENNSSGESERKPEEPRDTAPPPTENVDSAPRPATEPTDDEPVPSESPTEQVPVPRGQTPPGPGLEVAPQQQMPPQPAPPIIRPEPAPMPAPAPAPMVNPTPRVMPH